MAVPEPVCDRQPTLPVIAPLPNANLHLHPDGRGGRVACDGRVTTPIPVIAADPRRCADGCDLDFDGLKPMPCDAHGSIGPFIDDSEAP